LFFFRHGVLLEISSDNIPSQSWPHQSLDNLQV